MSATEALLRRFACRLLERRGALIEWPESVEEGHAVLPQETAALLQTPEFIRLSHRPESGGLCLNLATDCLDRLAPVVEREPRVAHLRFPDLYLKRGFLDEAVARSFTWLNARVRVIETEGQRIEYHLWAFQASLRSEENRDELLALVLNPRTGAEVPLPDVFGLETGPWTEAPETVPDTRVPALRRACVHLERQSAAFVQRLEERYHRDRRRLREYYDALLKETHSGRHGGDSNESLLAKQRVVKLELSRKLTELEERYALRAEISPLVFLRMELPALAVKCEVQRRQAKRLADLYWNPLLTALEPLACSACGESGYRFGFTDDRVAPRCPACL